MKLMVSEGLAGRLEPLTPFRVFPRQLGRASGKTLNKPANHMAFVIGEPSASSAAAKSSITPLSYWHVTLRAEWTPHLTSALPTPEFNSAVDTHFLSMLLLEAGMSDTELFVYSFNLLNLRLQQGIFPAKLVVLSFFRFRPLQRRFKSSSLNFSDWQLRQGALDRIEPAHIREVMWTTSD